MMRLPGEKCRYRLSEKYKPKKARSGLTGLEFANGETGFFYVRGSIIFPKGLVAGCGLLAIQHRETREIVVTEQMEFDVVETQVVEKEDGAKVLYGLARWLRQMYERYCCTDFFSSAKPDDMLYLRYRRQINRATEIKNKPHMIPTYMYCDNDENADRMIYEAYIKGKYVFEGGSELHRAVEAARSEPDKYSPYVECFRSLIAGYYRYPFREEKKDKWRNPFKPLRAAYV